MQLSNGCLCCSVRDTGLLAIQNLIERKRMNKGTDGVGAGFDLIVLETTGLADPVPIMNAFWNESTLGLGELTFYPFCGSSRVAAVSTINS